MTNSKKLLWMGSILGLVALAFAGVSLFAYLRLSNIKQPLISTLQQYIDGRLEMESADLKLLPPGLELQGVTLWAPGEEEPSAKVKSAKLSFNLLPLIQKKIESELEIENPVIYLRSSKKGPSNMEAIFAPVMARPKEQKTNLGDMWWRRIAVEKLTIDNAEFLSQGPKGEAGTHLKNIYVEADQIRFEDQRKPARLKIRYELPQYSKEPLALDTLLRFYPEKKVMNLEEGQLQWGQLTADLGGEVLQSGGKGKDELELDLHVKTQDFELAQLDKILIKSPGLKGKVNGVGTVTGSPFAPLFSFNLDSPQLRAKAYTLSNLHSLIQKDKKYIHIKDTHFGLFGGQVGVSGKVNPKGAMPTDLNLKLSKLSVAAATGKKDMPARLSGNLSMKSPSLAQAKSYSGGGHITVGPIPLPQMDFKKKIRIAEVLSTGTGLNNMVNVGMLGNSANVIGTQVDQVKAKVSIGGGNITLHSFNLGNGHFHANGSGKILQQKSVMASGTFTLNSRVTRQFITDPLLRRVLTEGKNQLSFPFSITGSLSDPKVAVDSSSLKGRMAAATALMLQRQLAGGQINPQGMLNEALKGTPAGDPKNPLGQFLGAAVGEPAQQPATTQQRSTTSQQRPSRIQRRLDRQQQQQQQQPAQKEAGPSTGNALADQLLFGR